MANGDAVKNKLWVNLPTQNSFKSLYTLNFHKFPISKKIFIFPHRFVRFLNRPFPGSWPGPQFRLAAAGAAALLTAGCGVGVRPDLHGLRDVAEALGGEGGDHWEWACVGMGRQWGGGVGKKYEKIKKTLWVIDENQKKLFFIYRNWRLVNSSNARTVWSPSKSLCSTLGAILMAWRGLWWIQPQRRSQWERGLGWHVVFKNWWNRRENSMFF